MKRKKETSDGRRDCADEKAFRPAIDAIAGEEPKQNDKACKDGDQADQRVNNGVDLQSFHFSRIVILNKFWSVAASFSKQQKTLVRLAS